MFKRFMRFLANLVIKEKLPDHQAQGDHGLKIADPLPFVANPDLIAAIHALKKDNSVENRKKFEDFLKAALVIIAFKVKSSSDKTTQEDNSRQTSQSDTNDQFGIASYEQANKSHFHVFTDLVNFQDWQKNQSASEQQYKLKLINCDILCYVVLNSKPPSDGIVINNHHENFLVEHEFFFENAADEDRPHASTELIKTSFEFLVPSETPEGLVEKLTPVLEQFAELQAVWATKMTKAEKEYFALLIDFTGNEDNIIAAAYEICTSYFDDSEKTVILSANNEPFDLFLKDQPPIFARKGYHRTVNQY